MNCGGKNHLLSYGLGNVSLWILIGEYVTGELFVEKMGGNWKKLWWTFEY